MLETIRTPGDTSWFVRDRFGLFIHWGLYSMPARHEWIKSNESIPNETYDSKYFKRFDPDLYTALLVTPVAGDIPGEQFRRLPAWCVSVDTPCLTVPLVGGGDEPLHGVFAWLDWRKDRGEGYAQAAMRAFAPIISLLLCL
jgi:hypothetical protein